jgi:hypothetical protein
LRIFSDPSPIGELTEVNVAGMGVELDHGLMLPQGFRAGQMQKAPFFKGRLVKR